MELVIARHLLGEPPAAVVLEHDEAAQQRKKPLRLANARQQHLQLQELGIRQRLAFDGAPRLEPLAPGGERTDPRHCSIGDDQRRVHGEQARQFPLVGLQLLPRRPNRRLLLDGALEFDQDERQAVQEQHDVRPPLALVLDDGELVDGKPVVVGGVVEVHDLHLRTANGAVRCAVLDANAIDEQPMERTVAQLERCAFGLRQLAVGVFERRGGEFRIEPFEGVSQAVGEEGFGVVAAFGSGRFWGDVWAVGG